MSTLAMQTSNKIETVVSFFNTDFFTTKTEKGKGEGKTHYAGIFTPASKVYKHWCCSNSSI